MRDYFSLMSDGEFDLDGYIINPDNNHDNVPEWIMLPNTKEYYASHYYPIFINAVMQVANAAGFDISTNSTTKLAIIYAGHTYRGKSPDEQLSYNGLNPRAFGNTYLMGERFAPYSPYVQERPDAIFCGIGIHAHEFGHLLGWPDLYIGKWSNGEWDLMGSGNYNPVVITGTNNKWASAPAPANPGLRYEKGWINYVLITSDITFSADYDLKDPEVFKIANDLDSTCFFLIENRDFEETMNFNGIEAYDYNHFVPWDRYNTKADLPTQGLLIWGYKRFYDDGSAYFLIQADGFNHRYLNPTDEKNRAINDGPFTAGDSGDPFPGFWDVKVLSPWSFPDHLTNSLSPNTLPSDNIGLEIIEMGFNYIMVDLYAMNPENASPSKPALLETSIDGGYVFLNWYDNNLEEPYFDHYEIWEKIKNVDPDFHLKTTTTATSYRAGISDYKFGTTVYFKVRAVDNTDKVSLFSNTVAPKIIVGFPGLGKRGNGGITEMEIIPKKITLATNYPNPFNPTTTIRFSLPEAQHISINIYSITGEKVNTLVDGYLSEGYHQIFWNGLNQSGGNVASGVYIYELQSKDKRLIRKMLLTK